MYNLGRRTSNPDCGGEPRPIWGAMMGLIREGKADLNLSSWTWKEAGARNCLFGYSADVFVGKWPITSDSIECLVWVFVCLEFIHIVLSSLNQNYWDSMKQRGWYDHAASCNQVLIYRDIVVNWHQDQGLPWRILCPITARSPKHSGRWTNAHDHNWSWRWSFGGAQCYTSYPVLFPWIL